MPTGYTAALYEGKPVTFTEFALRCSRAFGATIMLRDDPSDTLPTEDNVGESGEWNRAEMSKARERKAALLAMEEGEVIAAARAANEAALKSHRESVAESAALQARYEAMLAEVEAWDAPPDHQAFKVFMAEQLRESIRFDCGYTPSEPELKEPDAWFAAEVDRAEGNLDYHSRQEAEREQRNAGRREWVRALRASLPPASDILSSDASPVSPSVEEGAG